MYILTVGFFPGTFKEGYFDTTCSDTLLLSSTVGCLLKVNIALATPLINCRYALAVISPFCSATATSRGNLGKGNGSGISDSVSSSRIMYFSLTLSCTLVLS